MTHQHGRAMQQGYTIAQDNHTEERRFCELPMGLGKSSLVASVSVGFSARHFLLFGGAKIGPCA